ncbi:MAG TPA: hypothetical protein VF274_06575 [Alphaproteobacteria bacterium]
MGRLLVRLAAAAMFGVLLSAPGVAEDEGPESFPDGPGRDETFYLCTACHSGALIRQQGMSREQWDESISWMTERHGMPKLDGEDRRVVLDYLTRTFPPRRRGPPNPFLK